MRTTVNLDEALIERAKTIAATTGRSFSDVIEDAVRESMARRDQARGRHHRGLPIDPTGGGTMPGVDLDSNAGLLDVMDVVEP
jgi:predicted transcriptional regulator